MISFRRFLHCWKCQKILQKTPQCPGCTSIQPVSTFLNYFQLLNNHQVTFNINQSKLKESFIQLQKIFHPDRISDAQEKQLAQGESRWLNKAYRELKDPLRRAEYMVSAGDAGFANLFQVFVAI